MKISAADLNTLNARTATRVFDVLKLKCHLGLKIWKI